MLLAAHRAGRKVSVPGRHYQTLRGRLALLLERLGDPHEPQWRKWSNEELLTCIRMSEAGRSNTEIAVTIGRTPKAVRSKMSEINRVRVSIHWKEEDEDGDGQRQPSCTSMKSRATLSSAASSPAKRKCLRCGKLFHSAHAGNRLCVSCAAANRSDGLSANYCHAESWG